MRRHALLVLLVLGSAAGCASARPPAPAQATQAALTGSFHVVWGDGPHFWLIDDRQQWTELVLDDAMRRTADAARLDGRRVRVAGERIGSNPPRIRVTLLESLSP